MRTGHAASCIFVVVVVVSGPPRSRSCCRCFCPCCRLLSSLSSVVVVGLVVVVLVVVSVVVVSVVVVVVIVVIVVAAWSCGYCRCYLCNWNFLVNPLKIVKSTVFANPKKRQIGGGFAIFHILGNKKNRKYRCFWLRSLTQNHGIYEVLSLCEQKITVFTVFCGPGLAKNTGIYAVSCMLSEAFFWMPKAQKHWKLYDFYAWTIPKNYEKLTKNRPKKRPTRTSTNASANFTFFFSHPEAPKT